MTSPLQGMGSAVYHWFWPSNPVEMTATLDNLHSAIRNKGQDVLQLRFKDTTMTYSAPEYAILMGDNTSLSTLLSWGAKVEKSTFGTLLHLYVTCLKFGNLLPIDILHLLLGYVSDVHTEKNDEPLTALEYALRQLELNQPIHWSAIEALLQKGIRTGVEGRPSPWRILVDSRKEQLSKKEISTQEKKNCLDILMQYLALEKKHHPSSSSTLTLEEFKAFMPDLSLLCAEATTSLAVLDTETDVFSLKQIDYFQLANQLISYYRAFQKLVTQGGFKDCFEPQQLTSLVEEAEKQRPYSTLLLNFFQKWGLLGLEK